MIISTFKSVGSAGVLAAYDRPWEDIAEILMDFHEVENKTDPLLFNLCEFKSADDPTVRWARKYAGEMVGGEIIDGERVGGVWQRHQSGLYTERVGVVGRCKENVVAQHGLLLDVDKNMTMKHIMTKLGDDIEYVIYTTFSHSDKQDKFRVIIPFSQPLMVDDIAGRAESIIETFPGVDHASFTVSQCFYFHSGPMPTDGRRPFTYHNQGVMLNPYSFEYREPSIWTPEASVYINTEFTPEQLEAYKAAVVASLNTCSGLHYLGDTPQAVLTLVSICRSIGMTYNEYDAVCARMADPDSQLTNPTKRVEAWTGWTGDKIRGPKRDAFIEAYGGKPIDFKMPPKTRGTML